MGFLPFLPSCGKSGKRMNYGIFALLPSCGKSGKRMNYGIFATFAIMWQKWLNYCHHVVKVARLSNPLCTYSLVVCGDCEPPEALGSSVGGALC